MLFAIVLTYRRPKAEIETQLDAHRQWLMDHTRAGDILFAGPLESAAGGLVLAHGESRETMEALVASDPFVRHGLVDVQMLASAPALRHAGFPPCWAASAQSVPAA